MAPPPPGRFAAAAVVPWCQVGIVQEVGIVQAGSVLAPAVGAPTTSADVTARAARRVLRIGIVVLI
jgi:hypothetical protein